MWKHYILHWGHERRQTLSLSILSLSCMIAGFYVRLCNCVCDSNFPSFLRHVLPSTSQQHTNRKAGPFVFLVCCAEGLVQNMEVNMHKHTNTQLQTWTVLSCTQVQIWSWITFCTTQIYHTYPLSLNDRTKGKMKLNDINIVCKTYIPKNSCVTEYTQQNIDPVSAYKSRNETLKWLL